jgi:hypothetical protein
MDSSIEAFSVSYGMSLCSIHFKPWLAISQFA